MVERERAYARLRLDLLEEVARHARGPIPAGATITS
jgi:hypothetical protein